MKRARTVEEMRFAASLDPCPSCGARFFSERELAGDGHTWRLSGTCAKCGTARSFQFTSTGNPTHTRVGRFDLGPLRSELISAEQFFAVLDEATARVPEDPSALSPELRELAAEQLTRAVTSVAELMKLLPVRANEIPGVADPRAKRAWLSGEYKRLRMLVGKYARPSSISDEAWARHKAWLAAGAKGAGQLSLRGVHMQRELHGAVDLTFVEIASSDLTGIDLAEARLERGLFEEDVFDLAHLRAASLVSAVVRGGSWTRINATSARFNDAQMTGVDFSRSDLDESQWYEARVSSCRFAGVRFGSSAFDRAVFQACSFVDATLTPLAPPPEGTSVGAQFIDCDFTHTEWAGRDLRGTTFVRCKLAAAVGTPSSTDGLVVRECDLDLDAFLAQLRGVN